jgi:predicted transcriptional regulator
MDRMAEQETTTVRVTTALHGRLRALAGQRGTSIAQVLAEAIDAYERTLFWGEVRDWLGQLRADPDAWADYQRESNEWEDATIADGLEPEEWTDADFITPSAEPTQPR